MNSITRLILQRLASGKVRLTWEVIEVLKEVGPDKPDLKQPEPAGREPAANLGEPDPERFDARSHLTFVNPLPGRWIRRTGCVVVGALLLVASLFRASASSTGFDAANNAFAQGNYTEAARGFETVVEQQGYSAPVLFNLANAQQRRGQIGPAILNYERAALLAPNDPDIAANLQAARQQAGVEVKKPTAVQAVARGLTLNAWFGLAALAGFLIAAMLPLKQLRPQLRGAGNMVGVLAAFVLMASVGALGLRGGDLRRAVVTAPEAVAGIAPVTMAAPVFKLRAGEVVTLKQTHGDFALIVNPSGHEGWVKAENVERIIPLATPAKASRS